MFRAIVTGVVALAAVIAVLGTVFAVGALRIRMADNGPSDLSVAPPSALLATTQPAASGSQDPADAQPDSVPVINPLSIELSAESAKLTPGLTLEDDIYATKSKVVKPVEEAKKWKDGKEVKHKLRVGPPDAPVVNRRAIVGWHTPQDVAEWSVDIPKPGVYEVDIVCASLSYSTSGLSYTISVAEQELNAEAIPGGVRSHHSGGFKMLTAGNATLPAGQVKLQFHLADGTRHVTYLKLRSVRLIPAS